MEALGFVGENRTLSDSMTVKQTASMFRLLYNASYLNKSMSQYALHLLQQSTFRDGIIARVPDGIPVSHKFGEREDDDGTKQLHDCGIVYHPKTHYLICLMTKGHDQHINAQVLAELSRLIYEEVTRRSDNATEN
jgi:beta-lactamase class A